LSHKTKQTYVDPVLSGSRHKRAVVMHRGGTDEERGSKDREDEEAVQGRHLESCGMGMASDIIWWAICRNDKVVTGIVRSVSEGTDEKQEATYTLKN
jgi:hypothetical protein